MINTCLVHIDNELKSTSNKLALPNSVNEDYLAEMKITHDELSFYRMENKNKESALIIINNKLEKAEMYQKQYIKGLEKLMHLISHGIRQPICQIVGISNLLEKPNSIEEIKKMLVHIKSSASTLDVFTKELTTLIKKLRDKSHLKQEIIFASSF